MYRDPGIKTIKPRRNHCCYGMGLGVLLFDDNYPGFPGDLRNASAYPYNIQYKRVEAVNNKSLVFENDKETCLAPTIAAAKYLEDLGCRAILGECGYFAILQKDVAKALHIPVFMSSLLQIPLIQQVIGPNKAVGIVCAHKRFLTEEHLTNVGIDPNSNFYLAGAQDEYSCPEFDLLWNHEKRTVASCDYEKAEKDFVFVCQDFVKKHPDIGALMLECTGFQVFARAVQREVDLPVFSWTTLMDYAFSVIAHRDFYGYV